MPCRDSIGTACCGGAPEGGGCIRCSLCALRCRSPAVRLHYAPGTGASGSPALPWRRRRREFAFIAERDGYGEALFPYVQPEAEPKRRARSASRKRRAESAEPKAQCRVTAGFPAGGVGVSEGRIESADESHGDREGHAFEDDVAVDDQPEDDRFSASLAASDDTGRGPAVDEITQAQPIAPPSSAMKSDSMRKPSCTCHRA